MKIVKGFAVLIAGLGLAACGGGGGGGSDGGTPRDTTADFASITGLYESTIARDGLTDVSYFYVNPTGMIEQYNDLQDTYAGASSRNCYRRAIAGDVNAVFDGKQLKAEKDGAFTVVIAGATGQKTTFGWTVSTTGLRVNYDGISAGRLILGKGNDNIPGPLVLGGQKVTEPSIETIKGMICN